MASFDTFGCRKGNFTEVDEQMLKVLSAMVAVLQAHELKSTLNLVPFSRAVVPNLVPLCSKDTRGC